MTRSGPPGRTAAERSSHLTRVQASTPPSIDPARLDDESEAWIDAEHARRLAAGVPVSKRSLRRALLADWRQQERAERRAAETPVLTYQRHGAVTRSVPVDAAVGERVAARL